MEKNGDVQMVKEIEELLDKKNQIEKSLLKLEKQIYNLETSYLEDANQIGNLVKGWDGGSRGNASATNKRKIKNSERIFSLSSIDAIESGVYRYIIDESDVIGRREIKGINTGRINFGFSQGIDEKTIEYGNRRGDLKVIIDFFFVM